MRVSVFGLGKLGCVLAAVLADAGHNVIGVDISQATVDAVNAGLAPVEETGLQDLMDRCHDRLLATVDTKWAILTSDVSFIVVPTPSLPDGSFSNEFVLSAIDAIADALPLKQTYHTVVVSSTVMPGSCDGEIRQHLEATGRQVGVDASLAYNPQLIAIGSVIGDMTAPDLALLGISDSTAADVVESILIPLYAPRSVPFKEMSLVNAELAKIGLNAAITMKLSFANTLAEICEGLPGGDAHAVADAIGTDSRVGRKYLQPATAFGGPCFTRDGRAFIKAAQQAGTIAPLAAMTDAVNNRQVERLIEMVLSYDPQTVAILGLAYKPGTGLTDESVGTKLADGLVKRLSSIRLRVCDPMAQISAQRVGRGCKDVTRWDDPIEAAEGADLVVICTPWDDFRGLQFPTPITAIDCWNIIGPQAPGVNVIRIGKGPV